MDFRSAQTNKPARQTGILGWMQWEVKYKEQVHIALKPYMYFSHTHGARHIWGLGFLLWPASLCKTPEQASNLNAVIKTWTGGRSLDKYHSSWSWAGGGASGIWMITWASFTNLQSSFTSKPCLIRFSKCNGKSGCLIYSRGCDSFALSRTMFWPQLLDSKEVY